MAQNVSLVLKDQGDINKKLETKLNALEATVIGLGDHLQEARLRQQLLCHASY